MEKTWKNIAVMKMADNVNLYLNYNKEMDKLAVWINQHTSGCRQALLVRYTDLKTMSSVLKDLDGELLISAKYGRYLDVFKKQDGSVVIRQTLTIPQPKKSEICVKPEDMTLFLGIIEDVLTFLDVCREKLEPVQVREVFNDIVAVALENVCEETLIGTHGKLSNVSSILWPLVQGKSGDDIDGPCYSLSKALAKQKYGLSKYLPLSIIHALVHTLILK